MNTLRTFLVALLPLCLLMAGCDSGSDILNPEQTNEGSDQVAENIKDGTNIKDPAGNPVETFEVTLKFATPDGIPGDFLVNGEVVCAGAATCEYKIDDLDESVQVDFECPTHVFVPRQYEPKQADNGQTVSLDWSEPTSWGLAPNDSCYLNEQGSCQKVSTGIDVDKVVINTSHNVLATVTGNTFHGEKDNGATLEGTIADDLSTITWKLTAGDNVFEGVLTKQ